MLIKAGLIVGLLFNGAPQAGTQARWLCCLVPVIVAVMVPEAERMPSIIDKEDT